MLQKAALWGGLALIVGLADLLAADTLDRCDEAEVAPEVLERVVRFDLERKVFSRYGREPAPIVHGSLVRLRFPLQVEGGDPSALRYTGSPLPAGSGPPSPPSRCQPPVEEAPDCDGAGSPFYDVWIVNHGELSPECLRKVDLGDLLCIESLESHSAVLRVNNQQPCSQALRVGLLMTVKSTQPVKVDGRLYRRQYQTPDPTLILEPPDEPPDEPPATPGGR